MVVGWKAVGDGARPLPTVTANLLGEPGCNRDKRALNARFPPHYLSCPVQWCSRKQQVPFPTAAPMPAESLPWPWQGGLTPIKMCYIHLSLISLPKLTVVGLQRLKLPQHTFFVGRLRLRRVTKTTRYQPIVRNILLFPALKPRHIVFLLLSAPFLCQDSHCKCGAMWSTAPAVQGSTEQQEQSWWSWRVAHAEHNFTLQLLTLVLATHRQAIPRL